MKKLILLLPLFLLFGCNHELTFDEKQKKAEEAVFASGLFIDEKDEIDFWGFEETNYTFDYIHNLKSCNGDDDKLYCDVGFIEDNYTSINYKIECRDKRKSEQVTILNSDFKIIAFYLTKAVSIYGYQEVIQYCEYCSE